MRDCLSSRAATGADAPALARAGKVAVAMIVVFDGLCNVCNGFVRFLEKRDTNRAITFVPAQSARGAAMLAACGEPAGDPSTMIVVDRGEMLFRSDAVLAAAAGLGGGWRAARFLRLVPRLVRDPLYTGFARRRYRWFGRAAACTRCELP